MMLYVYHGEKWWLLRSLRTGAYRAVYCSSAAHVLGCEYALAAFCNGIWHKAWTREL